jgi:hypothetical protein
MDCFDSHSFDTSRRDRAAERPAWSHRALWEFATRIASGSQNKFPEILTFSLHPLVWVVFAVILQRDVARVD